MNLFKAHTKPVYSLAFSPDGGRLLTTGGDEKAILWSLNNGRREQEWPGSPLIAPAAFSPDGDFVGIGGYSIRVWRVGTAEPPVVDSREWATSCAFSPDGAVFAAFGAERPIMRWSIPAGAPLPGGWGGTRTSHDGRQFPTGGMAFHPDGAIIASVFGVLGGRGFDSVIHLWDTSSGALLGTLPMPFGGEHPRTLAFSPDGSLLAAEKGSILHVFTAAAGRWVAALQVGRKHFQGFAFTPDGRALLAVGGDTMVRSWDTAAWTENASLDAQIGKLTAIAISTQGAVAVGSATGKVGIVSPARSPL